MKPIFRITFCVVMAAIILPMNLVQAQQEEQALVTACIDAQKTKFRPLKKQSDAIYNRFANQSSATREVIRWLEDNPAVAEEKRLAEVARLTARLEAMKSLKDLTTGDALKDVKTTIETGHSQMEDLNDARADELRPIERQRSALQREFKDQEDKLEPIMEALFFEKGNNELTKDLNRNYASFSYLSGESGGQFKKGDVNSTVCSLRVYLVHDSIADEKLGKLDEKYPIVSQRDSQLEILVGDALVTLYSSKSEYNKENLGKTLTGLVDLEKLQSLLK
ncbi:MAG: hypothetical protein AAFN77_10680 [Planctomycetota bacterium]